MNKRLTFVDLFSGAGGLMRGFLDADYQALLSVEVWQPAINTHKLNYSHIPLFDKDIRCLGKNEIDFYRLHQCDVVIGGPPCQGFSTIGKQLENDPRNALVYEYIRIVDLIKPKFFLMENVKGLLFAQNNKMVDILKEKFRQIGYRRVVVDVMCAADYSVPQMRRRVIFLGVRDDVMLTEELQLPSPTVKEYKTVGSAIMDLVGKENMIPNHIPMRHNTTVVNRIKSIPEGNGLPNNLDGEIAYGSRSDYKDNKLKNFSHVYKRLSRYKPATTMVPGHNAFPLHPTEDRSLTVREAARLQTFDDDVIFCGTRQEQCIQVGNAVPVKMANALANQIKKYLGE